MSCAGLWQPPPPLPPTQNNSKRNVATQKRHKNFDNTTIADLIRTISNESHQTGVVNQFTGSQPSN